MSEHIQKLPELLCPAGSPEALDAAIDGGADAIYLGGAYFNARMNAHNFGGDALRSAVLRAHAYGVKVYLTLNTLITDREMTDFIAAARAAADAGVDALIVADLGGAAAIHRVLPSMELHASTQMSGHNASMAHTLQAIGFSRMVAARELSAADLALTVRNSPLEIEAFIHGALCVSHSGQCLFSALVGGRSGNRGECAQPCRLPYVCGGNNTYPLSLKDLSLAMHVPALIESGVASLKIEGRMKSPTYVRDTARIWRRLLDERRAATADEMRALADAFSRGGFTDGYYTKHINRRMLGVRSQNDKEMSRTCPPFQGITRKIPVSLTAVVHADEPIRLTVSDEMRSITVTGEIPAAAINAPLTKKTLERNLSKLGGTPYGVHAIDVDLENGLMLPISHINDLRRRAVAAWEATAQNVSKEHTYIPLTTRKTTACRQSFRTARFYSPSQITPRARAYFDRIYLPLGKESADCDGVVLPPVIFESSTESVLQMLEKASRAGIRYALVGNLGHLALVRKAGLIPVGDFRLNVTNEETVCVLEDLGVDSVILSPECTLPQARDIGGNTSLIVYGRIPLMTLEKCVAREIADCHTCESGKVLLTDRRGVAFPVLREWEHRNVIYNSLPTCMSDRRDLLNKNRITAQHFLFSNEGTQEVDAVIAAFEHGTALDTPVRRI